MLPGKTVNFDEAFYRKLFEKASIELAVDSSELEVLCTRIACIIKKRCGVFIEDADFLLLEAPEWKRYVVGPDKRSWAKNFVTFLFSTSPFPHTLFPENFLFDLLLVQRDAEFLDLLLDELSFFAHCLCTLSPTYFSMAFGRICSIIPFLEPKSGREIVLPQYVQTGFGHNEFKPVRFRIERIAITPAFLGTPWFAYSLEPAEKDVEPLLVFMGTPPPATNCSFLSLMFDLTPFFGVGELAFDLYVNNTISRWLQSQSGSVKVYGQSLGGSLALMTFLQNPKMISEAHAYGPAAPSRRKLRHASIEHAHKVFIYTEENDPVPYVGAGWGRGWNVFYGITKRKEPFFLSHLRPFPLLDPVAFLRFSTDGQLEGKRRGCSGSWKRLLMNVLHWTGSLVLFVPLLLLQAMRSVTRRQENDNQGR